MSKISLEAIEAINANCSNGFQFDRYDFAVQGEKKVTKTIPIDDKKQITATLYFREEVIKINHGYTKMKIPVLNVSVWTKKSEDTMWGSGMGKFKYFKDKAVARKNMSVLEKLTAEITDDLIESMAVDNRDQSIF